MKWKSVAAVVATFVVAPIRAESIDWSKPEAVVQAAVEASPSLATLREQIRAASERVISAGSLPNPMLMGGVQNQTVDLSYDFMTMYMVGASQTLVRKSRREALRRSAEIDVERLQREFDARRAEVERDVRVAYIDAAAASNQLAATEEIVALLGTVTEATRVRYETGSVPQADLIRAMLEKSNVEHEVLALRRVRNAALAQLLPLLNLPANTPVPEFSLEHEMKHQAGHSAETGLPDVTAAIAALQADVDRADQDMRLARLSRKPDIDVEASYGVRPRDVDMINLVARMELPVRKSTIIEPRIREATARRAAASQQIETLRQQLRQDIGVAVVLRNEALQQIDLHVDKLVPQARLGFESSLTSYQNGKSTFESVLGSLRTYRALTIDYYDFLKQQMTAEADIDAIRRGARSGISANNMGSASPSMALQPASTSGTQMR